MMAIARERCVLPPLRCMLRGWLGAPAVLGLRLRLPQAQAAPQGALRGGAAAAAVLWDSASCSYGRLTGGVCSR